MTEIDGQHTGENLASYLFEIVEGLGIASQLFCITADNCSSNGTLSRALENRITHYKATQHMLGCVGHVVNLAAKAGLKAMGHIVSPETPQMVLIENKVDFEIFIAYFSFY